MTGVELETFRSWVQRPNHYATFWHLLKQSRMPYSNQSNVAWDYTSQYTAVQWLSMCLIYFRSNTCLWLAVKVCLDPCVGRLINCVILFVRHSHWLALHTIQLRATYFRICAVNCCQSRSSIYLFSVLFLSLLLLNYIFVLLYIDCFIWLIK